MEAESSAKRQRLSPPCWPSVCVVFHCFAGNPETDEFKFYIVNSNSDSDSSSGGGGGAGDGDEFRHKEPTIRFKLKGIINPAAAFCALQSTLYIFEGDNHHHQPVTGRGCEGRFAGKFVIPKDIFNGSGYLLQKEELVRIKDMHENKFLPKAIPTPDGNYILLFSSDIRWNGGFYDDSFELYDVKADSWKVLPRLPPPPRVVHLSPGIETYGFETESRFLIQNDIGIFVFDLNKGSWDQSSSESCLFDNPRGNFFGIDGFSFAPGYAYDINGSEFQYPPLTLFPEDDDEDHDLVPMYLRHGRIIYPYATLLGRKDCVFDMSVVQARWRTDRITNTENVRVILDMYRTNIDKFKIDMEKFKIESEKYNKDLSKYDAEGRRGEEPVIDTTVLDSDGTLSNTADAIKTFKFMIDFDFFTYDMGQMYLFSI